VTFSPFVAEWALNPVDNGCDALPQVRFALNPQEATQQTGNYVLRFRSADEDGNGHPEIRGQFLRDLAARSHARAQDELTDMREFARAQLGIEQLMPWDHRFVAERLREQRFAFGRPDSGDFLQRRRGARLASPRVFATTAKATITSTSPRTERTPLLRKSGIPRAGWHPKSPERAAPAYLCRAPRK
jgi:hypothetical protein